MKLFAFRRSALLVWVSRMWAALREARMKTFVIADMSVDMANALYLQVKPVLRHFGTARFNDVRARRLSKKDLKRYYFSHENPSQG